MALEKPKQSKSKKKRSGKVVCFDEEIVTKGIAKRYLLSEPINNNSLDNLKSETGIVNGHSYANSSQKSDTVSQKKTCRKDLKRKKAGDINKLETNVDLNASELSTSKKKKRKQENGKGAEPSEDTNSIESNTLSKKKKKKHKSDKVVEPSDDSNTTESCTVSIEKRKKHTNVSDIEVTPDVNKAEEISLDKPSVKQEESIRAQKRKKHAKLLEEKRLKAVLASQQSALSYLSLWKHNRKEWKFEKLKQIWLQQNILDVNKIPNEFWNTVIDYFSGSRGSIRKVILKSALDVIEKEEKSEEESTDESYSLILQRARDIVQNLQE